MGLCCTWASLFEQKRNVGVEARFYSGEDNSQEHVHSAPVYSLFVHWGWTRTLHFILDTSLFLSYVENGGYHKTVLRDRREQLMTLQQQIVDGHLDWIMVRNRCKVMVITKQFGLVVESNFATADC
jgi:hypothetical protein